MCLRPFVCVFEQGVKSHGPAIQPASQRKGECGWRTHFLLSLHTHRSACPANADASQRPTSTATTTSTTTMSPPPLLSVCINMPPTKTSINCALTQRGCRARHFKAKFILAPTGRLAVSRARSRVRKYAPRRKADNTRTPTDHPPSPPPPRPAASTPLGVRVRLRKQVLI